MKILSHRGYWKSHEEKNTRTAFERSFQLGFGTETDLRDHHGNIVISHDMPTGHEMSLETLLDLAQTHSDNNHPLTLALNIKSDGLQHAVTKLTEKYTRLHFFVFDMSTPDMRLYLERKVPTYTRLSDIEPHPVCFDAAQGVWLDNFSKNLWFDAHYLSDLLQKKNVCVVSSELHGNDPKALWHLLKPFARYDNLALCTDTPEQASDYMATHL